MKKTYIFAGTLCLILNSFSFGAMNAYLRLTGKEQGDILGSATQVGREGSIVVIAFSHELMSPRNPENGLPGELRQHAPLRITKEIDKSTPLLVNAWSHGERMSRFELRFWRPSQTGQEIQTYTIRLVDAQIVSIRQEMLNNRYPENTNHWEREHVTFVYREIEWVYEPEHLRYGDEWQYAGADLLVSDLSGDGIVNLLDLAIFASEWLESTR